MAQGTEKLTQHPTLFCRTFSCSGSYSKWRVFWLFWQISENSMPKWRTCYFWKLKRPIMHCTSSLLVGVAKGSNLSSIWAEIFWHGPSHQALGQFTIVAISLISIGFISCQPACMGLTKVSSMLFTKEVCFLHTYYQSMLFHTCQVHPARWHPWGWQSPEEGDWSCIVGPSCWKLTASGDLY